MDWNGPTPNTLRIGTEFLGSGMAANPIDFVTGGVVRMSVGTTAPTGVSFKYTNLTFSISESDSGYSTYFNDSLSGPVAILRGGSGQGIKGYNFYAAQAGVFGWGNASMNAVTSPITGVDTGIGRNAGGVVEINTGTLGAFRDLRVRSVIQQPPATITPASNGDLVVEATSNTLLTFKFKGSDGTVRSGTLVVA
jgi:hypothetical protein